MCSVVYAWTEMGFSVGQTYDIIIHILETFQIFQFSVGTLERSTAIFCSNGPANFFIQNRIRYFFQLVYGREIFFKLQNLQI